VALSLYLDDCSNSNLLADLLRQAGHLVARPTDDGVGLDGADDQTHFGFAAAHGYTVITKNPADFKALHDLDQRHSGILGVYQDEPMADVDTLTEIEQLLLVAAAVHGLGPQTNLNIANADKVVGQALEWAGLMGEESREAWEQIEYRPAIVQVYGALIRMTHQILQVGPGRPPARPGEALFEGGGNFGTADAPQAFPHFTSCRLSVRGEQLARQLLEQHPEYGKRE
jgi:hypothetical protein